MKKNSKPYMFLPIRNIKKVLLFMKLTTFLFIISLFSVTANNTYSQSARLSIDLEDAEVEDVFKAIEEQTEYAVFYKQDQVDTKSKVTIKGKDETVSDILDITLSDQDVNYTVVGKNIVITTQQEAITVTGKVTDKETGESIPGVTIVEKGTTNGTTTSIDGDYEITVQQDAVLVFSFVGMKPQEIAVGTSTLINIVLEPDVFGLEEVVVTALGISREKKSLGFAVEEVNNEEMVASGRTNVLDAVNSKVAGVQITNSGGQAGGGSSMVIRGFSSINYNNQPLFVVDGVPIDNSFQLSNTEGVSTPNRAIDLNPDEIESVSILKGGAATALYGIRAGNGAVIITTKKGSYGEGKIKIKYSNRFSIDYPFHLHETTSDYARGRYGEYSNVTHWSWGEAYEGNPVFPGTVGSGTTILDLDGDGTDDDVSGLLIPQYKDNYERFFVNGGSQQHTLSFSGGSQNNTFYASASTLQQNGIVRNQDYFKNSFLLNGTQKFGEKFELRVKANYINTGGTRFRAADGIIDGLAFFHNMYDIENFPWKVEDTGEASYFSSYEDNPMWIVKEEGEDWNLNRIIGNMGFTYNLLPWLDINYTAGIDNYTEKRVRVRPWGSVQTPDDAGDLREIFLMNTDINQDLILSGKQNLNDDLDISYLVGGNMWTTKYDRLRAIGTTFNVRGFHNISNTLDVQSTTWKEQKMYLGVYSDISFGFRNYLFVGVTGRNDWSSTLPADKNSFFYPSVNLGFILTEMTDIQGFNFIKFRASYAETANDAPINSLNDYFVNVDANNNPLPIVYNRGSYTAYDIKMNPDLKPEKSKEVELGLEMKALDNMIGLDFSYYSKKSIDQIIQQPVSNITGYTAKLVNFGEVQNKGIEAVLTINNPVKVNDLEWTTTFNFTKNKGEIIRIGESTEDDLDRVELASLNTWWAGARVMAIEGEPYGTIYGYPWTRYNVDTDDPNYLDAPRLIGADGYPTTAGEAVLLGNINPDWMLSMNTSLRYKGVHFGFTLERKQGGDIINEWEPLFMYAGISGKTKDRWYDGAAADGSDGVSNATTVFEGVLADGSTNTQSVPLSTAYYTGTNAFNNEEFVEDGSWWRLRTIYLGYSLPESLISKLSVEELTLTVTGKNLWLSTPYTGNDPELSMHGGDISSFDGGNIPNTRGIMFGLSVSF